METLCKLYLELANIVPEDCISAREIKLRDDLGAALVRENNLIRELDHARRAK